METLAKLFGGQARIKIMRLFLLNTQAFEIDEIVSRSRVTKVNARKEVNALAAMGFIKQKILTKEGARGAKKKVTAWYLNTSFQYLKSIRELLVNPDLLLQEDDLTSRFRQIGKIKLMIVSGVFIGTEKSRVDVLLVGDKLKRNILQQVIKGLEAEIGKELDYVVFDSQEFTYRLEMYDKLVCDVIDLPHQKLIDTGQLSTYIAKK